MNPKNDWNTSCVLLVFQYVLLIWHMKAMNADGGCTKESKLKTSRKTTQIQHKTRQKSDRIEENASRKLYQKEALVISIFCWVWALLVEQSARKGGFKTVVRCKNWPLPIQPLRILRRCPLLSFMCLHQINKNPATTLCLWTYLGFMFLSTW